MPGKGTDEIEEYVEVNERDSRPSWPIFKDPFKQGDSQNLTNPVLQNP